MIILFSLYSLPSFWPGEVTFTNQSFQYTSPQFVLKKKTTEKTKPKKTSFSCNHIILKDKAFWRKLIIWKLMTKSWSKLKVCEVKNASHLYLVILKCFIIKNYNFLWTKLHNCALQKIAYCLHSFMKEIMFSLRTYAAYMQIRSGVEHGSCIIYLLP